MAANLGGRFGALLFLVFLAGCGSSLKMGQTIAPAPKVTPVTSATVSLSDTSFDFGDNLVGNPAQQTVVQVTNTGAIPLTLSPALAGYAGYSLVAAQSCGTQLAAGASCPVVVTYTPTTPSAPASQTAVLNLNFGNVAAGTASTVNITGISAAMAAGTVTATTNPQVALYTITPPFAGNVTVSFGTTPSYGLQTWSVPTPIGGGAVSIEVAGMRANTAYHMQASVALQNGVSVKDTDHTFTTSSYTALEIPQITASTSAGQTPQSGVELVNPIGTTAQVAAYDLSGNLLWAYIPPTGILPSAQNVVKQLANGDYISLISVLSSVPLSGPIPPNAINVVREFDLIGNTVKEITMTELNSRLAAANFNVTLYNFHHEVTVLPNGHWLVLANTLKSVVLNGATTPTTILGDVIVDLDTNLNPVWVWNEFDHLDVNRHPVSVKDWTHTNAIIYSKDDGNILVSIRHQGWVVKVDYNNGAGAGDIIWRLGYQGDFKLVGGTDPTDWFYGQHGPSFTTSNTTGIFGLTLMDNGDFRVYPPTSSCSTTTPEPSSCLYSTIPIFQINETAKTATFEFHQILPTNLYSFFGGNSEILANGNVEYDLCGLVGDSSQIFEVTNQSTPQTVWNLKLTSDYAYRGFRLPSLYPGVQW